MIQRLEAGNKEIYGDQMLTWIQNGQHFTGIGDSFELFSASNTRRQFAAAQQQRVTKFSSC